MSTVDQLAASLMQQAEQPDPADSETTGGTDEVETSQEPVEANEDFELEAEQDGEVAEADEQDDESDPEDWYTVKVDGEELQVTLDEALKGYQRDADYRKKTMTLAEQRKEFESERSRINDLVGELESFVKREEESVDWEQLQEDNPKEYIRKKNELEKAKQTRDKAVQEQQKQMQEYVQGETQKLVEAMGGDTWTQEQRQADLHVASEYLTAKGFGDEDISRIVDHRLWTVIMDAAKAEKYQKTEAKVKEQVRKAHKSVKPGQKLPAGERKRRDVTNRIKSGRNSQEQVAALTDLIKLQR